MHSGDQVNSPKKGDFSVSKKKKNCQKKYCDDDHVGGSNPHYGEGNDDDQYHEMI